MKSVKIMVFAAMTLTMLSCSDMTFLKRQSSKSIPLDTKSPYMKVHIPNGDVYVLKNWHVDETRRTIGGTGMKYNFNRERLDSNIFIIPIDSVSLFETNTQEVSGTIKAMTVISGISAAASILCLTNPKACFGSCPTFYIDNNGKEQLQAEGFSASISPSLEANDIDALYHAKPSGQIFNVVMKNEALETHVVRHVNLLLIPKLKNRSVQDISGSFYQTEKLIQPETATADEGDIRGLISEMDSHERFSTSDKSNLKSDEFIIVDFSVEKGKEYGMVIGARQTLLTTFLLYQAFSYMGNDYGRWLSMLERNHDLFDDVDPSRFLGGIEIQTRNAAGFWSSVGEINEFGPLATDLHMIRLGKASGDHQEIRLKLNKGNWRIDYIALAEIGKKVEPLVIQPSIVLKNNEPDESALERLTNANNMLTTLPGDSYTLQYYLPADYENYSYAVESKGYYLEWMRDEWAKEESEEKLVQLIMNPLRSLKELAPKYKELEPSMEKVFWNSKYAH